jgi:hypothetical protein
MYDTATGTFKCAPIVYVTIHPVQNPSIALLVEGLATHAPIFLNLSLSDNRSPLPLGPFSRPVFLDYFIASGGYPS